ncbi:hypothetical protein [Tsuneonella sp. SYSU-LHT278]|uniref:hypothetical protein n=1 Tax=Tsuneonella sediminis TaxID=3416089 RepID=UPI003F7A9CF4
MASSPPDDGWSPLPEGWTWSDVGHGALDLAGMVPIIGEAADLTNAAWLASEEKYLDAGLSIISMVPVVGDVVGKGGKLATRAGGKLAEPAVKALAKMDFAKVLAPLKKNNKLAPHIAKIEEALVKWRKEVLDRHASTSRPCGIQECPEATKRLGQSAMMVGKTPVPIRILEKLTPAEKSVFERAIKEVEATPLKARTDKAIFYSGRIGETPAWKLVEKMEKTGAHDTVNTLSNGLLNRKDIRDVLPDDAMGFVDDLASAKLAENAEGAIKFVGDLDSINPNSVFRRIELPALLKNPKITPGSRKQLVEMKNFLDKKYGR